MASYGVDLLDRLLPSGGNVLAVLTYHRIAARDADAGRSPGLISATPDEFEEQVAMLARRYRPLGMEELIRAVRTPAGAIPPRSVLLTFDDAYPDFADRAWPILAHWAVPATLFVPTSYPGDSNAMFWWDRVHRLVTHDPHAHLSLGSSRCPLATQTERDRAYRHLHGHFSTMAPGAVPAAMDALEAQFSNLPPAQRSTLDWEQLRGLASAGVSLAPHSRTHARLDLLTPRDLADEVGGSLDHLRAEVGACVPAFAYPGGYVSPSVARAVREAGYEVAFTTERGLNDLRSMDRFMIRRLNVGSRSSPTLIRAQLLPIRTGRRLP
jgi:peptidoglycan/xylan/chitin deacetylase (PgdA/CDA1 family)